MTEMEYQVKKYKKNYEKSKTYSKELEHSILELDQKIKDLKRSQQNTELVTQIEDNNGVGEG